MRFATFSVTFLAFLTPSCASAKHLVFFTNTTIGVEIAAEPNATTPAKFIVGYKRQEGVLDPIFEPTGSVGEATGTPNCECVVTGELMPEAHSVLAKMNFGAGGAGASAAASQWFATGEAAINLSQAPGIAGAITGDAAIARAAATESRFLANKEVSSAIKTSAVWTAFKFIEEMASSDGLAVLARVEKFSQRYAFRNFKRYRHTGKAESKPVAHDKEGTPVTASGYQILNTYEGELEGSIETLQDLLLSPQLLEEGASAPPTDVRRTEILSELIAQKVLLDDFRQALHNSDAVIDALDFFAKAILTSEDDSQ